MAAPVAAVARAVAVAPAMEVVSAWAQVQVAGLEVASVALAVVLGVVVSEVPAAAVSATEPVSTVLEAVAEARSPV
jgi:hypothetical protein